jgi:hypothetical protein
VSQFVEATCVYRANDVDPRDPAGERTQKRLVNTEALVLVTPTTDGKNRTVFHLRQGESPSFFLVLEPYDYWVAVLTYDQPRPV